MKNNNDEIKRLVVFAILMQNQSRDIIRKSPGYIREKFYMAMRVDDPATLLDPTNKAIYDEYMEMWIDE